MQGDDLLMVFTHSQPRISNQADIILLRKEEVRERVPQFTQNVALWPLWRTHLFWPVVSSNVKDNHWQEFIIWFLVFLCSYIYSWQKGGIFFWHGQSVDNNDLSVSCVHAFVLFQLQNKTKMQHCPLKMQDFQQFSERFQHEITVEIPAETAAVKADQRWWYNLLFWPRLA